MGKKSQTVGIDTYTQHFRVQPCTRYLHLDVDHRALLFESMNQ